MAKKTETTTSGLAFRAAQGITFTLSAWHNNSSNVNKCDNSNNSSYSNYSETTNYETGAMDSG